MEPLELIRTLTQGQVAELDKDIQKIVNKINATFLIDDKEVVELDLQIKLKGDVVLKVRLVISKDKEGKLVSDIARISKLS